MQDYVLETFLQYPQLMQLSATYIPKIMAICHQGIAYKRSQTKKSIYDLRHEKAKLSLDDSARAVAYMLFIRHVMVVFQPTYVIPENFMLICEHLSQVFVREVMSGGQKCEHRAPRLRNDGASTKSINRWNYSLVYAFEFLQAGLCIYRNSAQVQDMFIGEQLTAEVGAPLTQEMKYTNLWRFITNILNQMANMRVSDGATVDVTQLCANMELQLDAGATTGPAEIRGPAFMHHLLVNNIFREGGDVQCHIYDLINQTSSDPKIEKTTINKSRRQAAAKERAEQEISGVHVPPAMQETIRKRPKVMLNLEVIPELDMFAE